jgi:thiamine pyrophosphate-dependent acetolactate synthase large subunit-like protein
VSGPTHGGSASEVGAGTGARAVARALRSAGVEIVFGLPGVHNLALWPAFRDAGIRIVGSRHEQGTVYAADGLARATGALGVALTTTGPGAANTIGAVGEAWASHSPVVVIATDIPTTQRQPGVYRGVLHESIAQAAMFVAVTKSTIDVADADGISTAIVTAATLARSAPTGPVYVGIPTNLLDAPAPAVAGATGEWSANAGDAQPVLDALAGSARPLLWIGGGARDAGDEIGKLALRLGAPIVTTYQARGVIHADHPLLVGAPPHEPPVIELIGQADLAVVIGSDLDAMTTMGWRLPLPERRVAINVDPVDATKNYAMDATLATDARIAGVLADALPGREPWAGNLAALVERLRDDLRTTPETAESIAFLEHTEAALPADAVVFADMCIPGYWLAGHYRVRSPRGLQYPMGWGTLGFAFPAAIGAAAAFGERGRPVVSVSGDGGMLFAIGELATAAQERLPLTAVVIDDGGYGMLRYGHDPDVDFGTELASVDFAAVARGFGMEARTVEGVGASYRAALAEAVASGAPNLLHVRAALYPPRSTSPRWPLRGA